MRILLAQNSPYYPAHGGGDKSNRFLAEALAGAGHDVLVVARTASFSAGAEREYLRQLEARRVRVDGVEGGAVSFRRNGVAVRVAANTPNFRGYFAAEALSFQPDIILCSTDDPAQMLLEASLHTAGARVVYLVRTTLALPFGPEAAFPSLAKTDVLRQVDGLVGVSDYVTRYVKEHGGLEAVHHPISLFEPGPYPSLGGFDKPYVLMVNPCAVKGIAIFLELARRMPQVAFAAVPTWGTGSHDLEQLRAHANISVLDAVDDADDLYRAARVLLMPSLWAEARGRVVVEAMARGIPVVASDVGGISEAMMGVDYLLPVNPILHYARQVDAQMVPVAQVPPQEVAPWQRALERLVTDRHHYEGLSRRSREAALAYVQSTTIQPFENYLRETLRQPPKPREVVTGGAAREESSVLSRLSPEKRRLLALRLKKKLAAAPPENVWFPDAGAASGRVFRLFCFPHAGGGRMSFHGWQSQLPEGVVLAPACLPGRESRLAESPIERMEVLVEALGGQIRPYTAQPFAFFGHSLGAVVGFELVRWLRRNGLPQPVALFASGARAPLFRQDHVPPPDPTDEEFLEELERLEGMPAEALHHPEALRVLLPALKADAALYRRYAYREEAPLGCPIFVYGGEADPNVEPHHLERWKELTTAASSVRILPGGHFFLIGNRDEFLARLGEDIAAVIPGR